MGYKLGRKKIIMNWAVITASAAVILCAFCFGEAPHVTDIIGAFAALFLFILISKAIRFPDTLYCSTMIFIFFASPLGSVADLYSRWGPYDKIIHFMSGILLAVYGMELFKKLMKAV